MYKLPCDCLSDKLLEDCMDSMLHMGSHISCSHRHEMVGTLDLSYTQCRLAPLIIEKQSSCYISIIKILNEINLTYQFTSFIAPPAVSWSASANHDSQGKLILNLTVCIWCTWPHMQTWVETFSIKAGMFGWAIPISNTAWFFNDRFRDWGEIIKISNFLDF